MVRWESTPEAVEEAQRFVDDYRAAMRKPPSVTASRTVVSVECIEEEFIPTVRIIFLDGSDGETWGSGAVRIRNLMRRVEETL